MDRVNREIDTYIEYYDNSVKNFEINEQERATAIENNLEPPPMVFPPIQTLMRSYRDDQIIDTINMMKNVIKYIMRKNYVKNGLNVMIVI
jgi:hypothetical protein